MVYTRVILLFVLVFGFLASVRASNAAVAYDVFPGAETVATVLVGDVQQHLVVTGEVKRVRTEYEPESARYIEGRLSSQTDRIHGQRNTKRIIDHYRNALAAKLLFECQGRDCGSSNYWANSYFNKALLYGPERYQAYFVGHEPGGDYFIVYIAQRGTGAIYVHQVVIEVRDGSPMGPAEIDLAEPITREGVGLALRMTGQYLMSSPLPESEFSRLVSYLVGHSAQNLVLVIHNAPSAGESIEAAVLRSESEANLLKQRLAAAGASSLSVYGLGPLAPDQAFKRNRTVLLRVD